MGQAARRPEAKPAGTVIKLDNKKSYSGLTTIRMTPAMHEAVAKAAGEAGRTLNEHFVAVLGASLGRKAEKPGAKKPEVKKEPETEDERVAAARRERDEARKALDAERKLRLQVQSSSEEVVERTRTLLDELRLLAEWGVEAGADANEAILRTQDPKVAEMVQAAWRRFSPPLPLFKS